MDAPEPKMDSNPIAGAIYAFSAFLIWGLSPIYWRALNGVDAFEIILHRIVWSFVTLLPLVVLGRQWTAFLNACKRPKTMALLVATSLLVSTNWLLYIWAVNNGRVLQASLGYYINPLVNIVLGVLFLRERLHRPQIIAVTLAAFGVLNLTFRYGVFPWVSLALAFSFGIYGLVRKTADVGPLVGLTIETLLLAIPAGIWVLRLFRTQSGTFLHAGISTDLLLIGTGILTATPLLLFNLGAKRITLASLGFIQYTAPTGMFLLGITLFKEPFTATQALTFGLIWTALAIYSWDAVKTYREKAGR